MQKPIVTIKHFYSEYKKYSGAKQTISSFDYNGMVYAVTFKHIPMSMLRKCFESSDKGGYFKLKVYWTVADKKKYINNGKAKPLMTLDDLMKIETKKNKNKGHKVEKYYAMLYKDENPNWKEGGNDRFDKCGDVIINGVPTQIKFGQASLTNINVIHNIQNEKRLERKLNKGLTTTTPCDILYV